MASRVMGMGIVSLLCVTTATAYTETAAAAGGSDRAEAVASETGSWLQGGWWIMPLGLIVLILFASSRAARLTRLPRQPWHFRPGMGYSFVLLAIFAGAVGAQVALYFTGPASDVPSDMLRTLTIVQIVSLACQGAVVFAMPGWWMRRAPGQEDTRPGFAFSAGFGVLGLVIFWPMVQATMLGGVMVRTWLTGEAPDAFAHDTLILMDDVGSSVWSWVLTALLILAVPVVEEAIYRGLLQESLRRHRSLTNGSPWMAVVITSVIFSLMHGGVTSLEGLVSIFILSLGLGWAFVRTGRLITPIIMHAGFNALNLLLASFQ